MNKNQIKSIILLLLGISLIIGGTKCTPQWMELQDFSRTSYLTISIILLAIGCLILYKPIVYMIIGAKEDDYNNKSEEKRK